MKRTMKSIAKFIAMLICALVVSQVLIGISSGQTALNQIAAINACGFGLVISILAFYIVSNDQ